MSEPEDAGDLGQTREGVRVAQRIGTCPAHSLQVAAVDSGWQRVSTAAGELSVTFESQPRGTHPCLELLAVLPSFSSSPCAAAQ